jgi:hypothetical protein
VVKEVEERALAGGVAADVKERVGALIKQLEDVDRHGIHTFSILSLIFGFFVFSSDGVFPSEAMTELEHLHVAVDSFLNFLGVALGAREERLWNARCHVLDAIESDVRRGARVALAMAEVTDRVQMMQHDACMSMMHMMTLYI